MLDLQSYKALVDLLKVLRKPKQITSLSTEMAVSLKLARQKGYVAENETELCLTPDGRTFLKKALSYGGLEEGNTPSNTLKTPKLANTESPLIWLKSRKTKTGCPMLTEEQFDAGERLREDFTYAQLWGAVRSNWRSERIETVGKPIDDVSDSAFAARQRVTQALQEVGPELAGILMDVCCFLKPLRQVEQERSWPARTAKVVLCLALDRLAAHYGSCRIKTEGKKTVPTQCWHSELKLPAQPPHHL